MPQAAGGVPMISAQAIGVTFALSVGFGRQFGVVSIGVAVAKNEIGGGGGNAVRATVCRRSELNGPAGISVVASVRP